MAATVVTNFSEIAIRGPRPGFFVGDCFIEPGNDTPGAVNPITKQYELNTDDIPPALQSSSALGSLTRLPIEILQHILGHLDILSVLEFLRVNQQCTFIVKSWHEFETVASFPKAMSATVNMKCRFYPISRLAACLRDTRCSRCEGGHFGELLYLITAERVCWPCWRRFRDYIPITKDERAASFSIKELNTIPYIVSVPGLYGEKGRVFFDPCHAIGKINRYGRITDRRAFIAALKLGGHSLEPDPDPDSSADRDKARAPRDKWQRDYYGRRSTTPSTARYMTFIRAPYWDEELQSFVGGYFCRACIGRDNFTDVWPHDESRIFPESIWHEPWRRYTREGFWKHIDKYGRILRNADGTFVHDSPRREIQVPDDVQWEMYRHETLLLAEGMDLPDDQPLFNPGLEVPHNCQ